MMLSIAMIISVSDKWNSM